MSKAAEYLGKLADKGLIKTRDELLAQYREAQSLFGESGSEDALDVLQVALDLKLVADSREANDFVRAVQGRKEPEVADLPPGASQRSRDDGPAVPVDESVSDDAIICLECGAKQRMLKRHLRTAHGLTPGEYRAKWGLEADYPLILPKLAEQRRQVAARTGLGKFNVGRTAAKKAASKKAGAKKGRGKKATARKPANA